MLSLSSMAFDNGQLIPAKFTADSSDISPPLAWKGEPDSTKSYALICDDADTPGNKVHWIIFNIPAHSHTLTERVPPANILNDGAIQGMNDFNHIGYEGPAPLKGKHHYYFKLYALDIELTLHPGITKKDLLQAIKGHVLDQAQLMGTYSRQ